MLGIEINNKSLDLPPGTTLEMELNNPFLQLTEEISGEFSLPVQVQNTPKNLRLLQYAGLPQTRPDYRGLDAKVYENGIQHSTGKIKLEQAQHDLNRTADGYVSVYYLSGTSSFFQDIKKVKLRSINTGGLRTFTWDGFDRSGSGFWGHIHQVIDAPAGAYDYAFYPVINMAEDENFVSQFKLMNKMAYTSGQVSFTNLSDNNTNFNVVVAFPYLRFVLQKIAEHIGYKIEGEILNDEDFKKITLLNFNKIIYGVQQYDYVYPVHINLNDCLPDVTVAEFLLGLKSRLGWYYDIDKKRKVIRIKELKNVVGLTVKDYSRYVHPIITKKVAQQKAIYAVKLSGEEASKYSISGSVAQYSNLPAAAGVVNSIYLVVAENNLYASTINDDTGVVSWEFFGHHLRGVIPEEATQEITTTVTTAGMESFNSYIDLAPRMDREMYWGAYDNTTLGWGSSDWETILLFYHGKVNNKAGQPVPYASSHIYSSSGQQLSNWSLTFQCKKLDGTEVGLYERNWKPILNQLSATEEITVTLNLPLHEYMQLDYSKIISINHMRMYVKKIKTTIPYKNSVQLECTRI